MNLKIRYFKDRGQLRTERVVLKVLADDNIGHYSLFRTLVQDGAVTNGVTHAFWFPDKTVRAGDFVILYTKEGTDSQTVSERGVTSHFFYWYQTSPMWEDSDFAAVALFTPDWISLTPQEP